eukprot:1452358-Amphidinium_carterae.1
MGTRATQTRIVDDITCTVYGNLSRFCTAALPLLTAISSLTSACALMLRTDHAKARLASDLLQQDWKFVGFISIRMNRGARSAAKA